MIIAYIAALTLWTSTSLADYRKLTEKGNKALTEDKVEEALKCYKDAEVEKPKQPVLDYNIGTALYKQDKYAEAAQRYARSLDVDDPKFQADAYYNAGSSLFRANQYAEAIAAFKKSLEINPDDTDAKYNLELARVKLKEQAQKQDQQQQDKQQNKQDEQDKQDKQDQQDKQQQDQQQGDEEQQQEQQSSSGDEDKQQQEQQQRAGSQKQQRMSKQDAERFLNAISGDEKNLQKQLAKFKVGYGDPNKGNKDW